MDRLEYIRDQVDRMIYQINNETTKRNAYVHTYGVCYIASIYAMRNDLNQELLCIMAMLHDIAKYKDNIGNKEHASKSSIIAKDLLETSKLFDSDEITLICKAIALHSDKQIKHTDEYVEALKDCDILSNHLYNQNLTLSDQEKYRLYYALEKIGL